MIEPKKATTQPIIIEEVYFDMDNFFQEYTRNRNSSHLFVFVHGFQATGNDMQQFKNHLHTILPNALFLIARSNEGLTDQSITKLGLNLANEVKQFVNQYLMGG